MTDWGQRPEYLEFANKVLETSFDPRLVTWLTSLAPDGEVLGVVVYSNRTATGCEMSVASASPKFLTRRFLRDVFAYPFFQLECERVTAISSTGNPRSINLNLRLGFVAEGLMRRAFPDGSGIVFGMLKEECKWVKVHQPRPHQIP